MVEGQAQAGLGHRLAGEPGLAGPHEGAGDAIVLQQLQPFGARAGGEDADQGVASGERVQRQLFPAVLDV